MSNDQEQRPHRTCDIVMKGGITSGVVYPKAIVTLATRFTFKNVGGTSAGAIAAAAAAAAEYRRIKTGGDEGFVLLGLLGDFLSEKPADASETRLFLLFQPNAGTRRLFDILTSAQGGGKSLAYAVLRRAIWQYSGIGLLGAAPGFVLAVFSVFQLNAGVLAWILVFVGILIGLAGAAIAIAVSFVLEFINEVPRNNFGLCSGMPDSDSTAECPAEPLTTWLTTYLNEVAGFEPGHRPLIFGDLWNPKDDPNQGDVRDVNLEMMTTNLTHGRPYRLPFRDDEDLHENHLFYFREDEFLRLFPKSVVDWMIGRPRPIPAGEDKKGERQREREDRAKAGYFPLPAPADLPVVVVTRMSLSFPFLLSAIPLHSIDRKKLKAHQALERCWFTDGGLCSNLPLHFFDSPLPRRPTFSIDLTEKPDDTADSELVPEMDKTNGGEPMDRWNRFDQIVSSDPTKISVEKPDLGKLTGFVWTMIATMQNWNDATVSRLPGYRDRIVRIPLTSKQGGLNLNMPPELVKFLTDQGGQCGKVLMEHFDVPAFHTTMTWENHRWIRIRSMLAALEKMIEQTLTTCENPENGDMSYEDWLEELLADTTGKYKQLSYEPTKPQIKAALETIGHLRELATIWSDAGTAEKKAPKPRPTLRPRPQI
ncbi:MAG: hypothetical protein ABIS50_20870 [Luteolibacter sp.]|uniref:hypothetical protein n=1 Tax=Luteolibacter sp. TaxID=1962973 RepID=UPI00326426A8